MSHLLAYRFCVYFCTENTARAPELVSSTIPTTPTNHIYTLPWFPDDPFEIRRKMIRKGKKENEEQEQAYASKGRIV